MTTRNSEPSPDPQNNGGEGADWEDEFGFDDRQFVVEDLTDGPELPLPPAVTGAPPAPTPAVEPPGEPSAQ
ncbi:hypothetical protein OG379_05080 [Streptomyces sp. NBC_01166]|uniref:hypothetical protein n=1 Tax=Streptomyces sp. NBC_01166 TaxID=2903755 RepID=UPI00386D2184|nr:hypothetical protein OG379_05080 [Streptomyces sp. NBC_01166]